MSNNSLRFTLLTASKNEEKDIRLSVESALSQSYSNKEIIFVDDSTDRTKDIIREYADRGVILVDGKGEGCCRARNLGLERATGDVIVFLTADTKLEDGYLEKLVPYYEKGYDLVMTESYSFNLETIYSRFVQAEHERHASRPGWNPFTTQGYSVRKQKALEAGLISGGVYPVNFCRDWTLAKKMLEKGAKRAMDREIRVPHKSPDNFSEFWLVQRTRGLMSAYQPYFFFGRSPVYLFLKFAAKSFLTFLHFALIVPALVHAWELAKFSPRGWRDLFPMYFAYFIHRFALSVGEWQGYFRELRLGRPKTA